MGLISSITPSRWNGSRLIAGLLLGSVLAPGSASISLAQESDDAETPSAADCNIEQALAGAGQVFTVVSEESAASYTVDEELVGIGANTAVGTTSAIIGAVLFDEDGNPLPCSHFAVDMRTLESDESRRDNFLRMNTLESEAYPYTTFIVAAVEGLDGPIVEGETFTAQLIGDLTIRDVTLSATWEAEFTLVGDSLTGTATHTFLIADYELQKPIVGSVVSIADDVLLTIDLVAVNGGE